MARVRRLFLRLVSSFRPGPAESDLGREVREHLQLLERAAYQELTRRLAAEPAVGGVTFTDHLPRTHHPQRWLEVDGDRVRADSARLEFASRSARRRAASSAPSSRARSDRSVWAFSPAACRATCWSRLARPRWSA